MLPEPAYDANSVVPTLVRPNLTSGGHDMRSSGDSSDGGSGSGGRGARRAKKRFKFGNVEDEVESGGGGDGRSGDTGGEADGRGWGGDGKGGKEGASNGLRNKVITGPIVIPLRVSAWHPQFDDAVARLLTTAWSRGMRRSSLVSALFHKI